MKKSLFLVILTSALIVSCTEQTKNVDTVKSKDNAITRENRPQPDFSSGILTEEILWHLGRVSNPQVSPDGSKILFAVKYFDYTEDKGNQDLYVIPAAGGEPVKIIAGAKDEFDAVWRPDSKKIAYLKAGKSGVQIWEANPDGTGCKQLTKVENGVNSFCYAPDMKHIIYTSNVQLDPKITDRYADLPKAEAMIYDDLMYRHWDYWADGTYQHIFINTYPVLGDAVELMKDEKMHAPVPPFGGMSEVACSPDGTKIAYCSKKMAGKAFAESTNSDIYIYDLATQQTVNLTESNKGYDMDPVFSPDGSKLVWWSMKTDGFESEKHRLFIHDFATGSSEDCSTDFDQDATNFVWSEDGNSIFFISCIKATHQIYKLDVATKQITQLTEGDHDYTSLALAGNKLVVTKTTHALPAEIFAVDIENGAEEQLTFTNKEYLDKITLAKTEKRWVKTTDGKEMLVWVILPPNFDANKKYPALLYCQGGPQQSVSQFFSYRWNFQMMAAHGYIVVAPNRRGLPGFGSEWNDQISLDYGGQNMKDYLSAIDDVAKENYVDENRLGAIGASYGGFSVYWLAGNHNNRFKAFMAHCGMFNFESWYATTEELFFANHDLGGPYWENPRPKSYDFSPHNFVGNWNTPILVVHGGRDFRIPYTEGMQAFNAAQIQGIPSRFLYFPDETHFVSKPQNAILWQRECYRWFDHWLK
ncbi:S9 family peptidase [Bacteroidales bacterium OttesenSCG-928-B11]|nr:S9 family peptidase [Bacteroidales bacterium OttesenSCG-928-E04]MDL2308495.1 S9 family peptidase [Bacteroidales bacterium OttesenSCG-928-C03]MDL2311420.1 S9 family peptidase [Bacteroidales bacterium OttesenSCG-928-B11]